MPFGCQEMEGGERSLLKFAESAKGTLICPLSAAEYVGKGLSSAR